MTTLKQKINELVINALKASMPLNKRQAIVLNESIDALALDTIINAAEGNYSAKKTLGRTMATAMRQQYGRGYTAQTATVSKIAIASRKNGPKHDKARFFGVEIECFLPGDNGQWEHDYDNEDDCENDNCNCADNNTSNDSEYRKALKEKFKAAGLQDIDVKHDGSIEAESGHYAAEITFTFSVNNYEKIAKVCKVLNDNGAKVNKSCGMHVHIDMRKLNASDIILQGENLVAALPVLQRLVPKSRVKNTYCLDNKGKFKQNSRYYAINSQSLSSHTTIEVRLHSATTNAEKITNWVKLLNTITSKNLGLSTNAVSKMITADFLQLLGLDSDTIRYFLKREFLFENESVNCEQKSVTALSNQNEAA